MKVNAFASINVFMVKLSKIVEEVWVQLLRAHKVAFSTVERALKDADLPPLAWYDVLLELERSRDIGLRPFELERALLLPQYGISRILIRIEKAGYLQKAACEEDGRGHRLFITPSGLKIRRRMWLVYSAAIEQAVGGKLTTEEAEMLTKLLRRLQ